MKKGDVKLGPWPLGVNTRATDGELPEGSLRDCVNNIVTLKGALFRRPGVAELASGQWHSGFSWAGRSYAVRSGSLCSLTKQAGVLSYTAIVTGLPHARVFYAGLGDYVYWSNGTDCGVIRDGVNYPWSLDVPSTPVLTAVSTGGMTVGTYLVALTFVDSSGREHGASYPAAVDVDEGGGFTIAPQGVPSGVAYINAYVSGPDGQELFLHATVAYNVASFNIGVSSLQGRPLEAQELGPVPAMKYLAVFNGAIYGAVGEMLCFTEPMRVHCSRPGNALRLGRPIALVGAVRAGLLVATDEECRFLGGNIRGDLNNDPMFWCGAEPGALTYLPGDTGIVWKSDEGICYTAPDGATRNLTKANVMLEAGSEGALGYRVVNGVKQVIALSRSGVVSEGSAQDYFDAEVVRAS